MVEAQTSRHGYSDSRDDRDNRGDYRQRINGNRYWRDDHGNICYRRSDGVRRCEAPNARRDDRRSDRYDRHRYQR